MSKEGNVKGFKGISICLITLQLPSIFIAIIFMLSLTYNLNWSKVSGLNLLIKLANHLVHLRKFISPTLLELKGIGLGVSFSSLTYANKRKFELEGRDSFWRDVKIEFNFGKIHRPTKKYNNHERKPLETWKEPRTKKKFVGRLMDSGLDLSMPNWRTQEGGILERLLSREGRISPCVVWENFVGTK